MSGSIRKHLIPVHLAGMAGGRFESETPCYKCDSRTRVTCLNTRGKHGIKQTSICVKCRNAYHLRYMREE